ncbi:hypothetical protein L204_105805 [Cryptococcus depauperatus]
MSTLYTHIDNLPSPRIPQSIASPRSSSSTEYEDNLDVSPFNEKNDRFRDDPDMEEGHANIYELEENLGSGHRSLQPRRKSRKILVILIGIITFAIIIGGLAASGYSVPSFSFNDGTKRITMDLIFNGTFAAYSKQINWIKEAQDGTFSHVDDKGNIVLNTVRNRSSDTLLVNSSLVKNLEGEKLPWQSWALSSDMEYVLFKTDHVKQWRHSSFGNYWIHRRKDGATFPVIEPMNPPTITKCIWSPVGHALAFVSSNDLYLIPESQMVSNSPTPIRITTDGSHTVFNGVPDWVYEEEVFETDSAFWWSPDAKNIAFLRSDESNVKDFKLLYYNPGEDAFEVHQYQSELDMKYPKPGTPNPLVSVHIYSLLRHSLSSLTWAEKLPIDDEVITEVSWAGNDTLLVKETDRSARKGNVVLFEQGKKEGKVVRILGEDGEEGDKGWIDHKQNVVPVDTPVSGYLDIVPNNGYNHIAFFSPLNSTKPIWLTKGEWEVTEISGVDDKIGLIYFTAAKPSIDRHIFSIPIPTEFDIKAYDESPTPITDTNSPGYYEAKFSPEAGYYVLSYKGPDVPWQRLIEADTEKENTRDEGERPNILLEGNSELNKTLSEYLRPLVTRTTIQSEGHELNMLEILPPKIDTTGRRKYPVLIRVYGGPGSQTVSNRFEFDWHYYLASTEKYIVVMLDGRGTGFKGRGLKNSVRDELGKYEVVDQLQAAKEMIKRRYVDRSRIGIWGWSYGGYLTCKTVEADTGVFTLGMAVAPVTNWLYYDSIYTERYMSTPKLNPEGYLASAVNNVTSFSGDKVDFIWAHGSGDDNVHYANSASLLDKLTQKEVRGWRFRMFTDSKHSMDRRHAYRELYEWMTDFLIEKWDKGGRIHHS